MPAPNGVFTRPKLEPTINIRIPIITKRAIPMLPTMQRNNAHFEAEIKSAFIPLFTFIPVVSGVIVSSFIVVGILIVNTIETAKIEIIYETSKF